MTEHAAFCSSGFVKGIATSKEQGSYLSSRFTALHRHPTRTCSPSVRLHLQPYANANSKDKDSGAADMDIIERIYTAIFGAKQAEPFGLKRFDRDRFPELYPATLDEFADPVSTDTAEMILFRPLLARTQLQTRELQLLFDANRDGWSAESFHHALNRKGASVVFARTAGATFGGYNPKGFVGYGESRGSKAAFLFTWPDDDTTKPAMKMRKVGGAALAVVDEPETGPKFGADSFVAPLRPPRAQWAETEKDRIAYSKLGSYYERRPDGGRTLFADGENPKGEVLKELKVFAGVYADGEEIPFDDALPFSLE